MFERKAKKSRPQIMEHQICRAIKLLQRLQNCQQMRNDQIGRINMLNWLKYIEINLYRYNFNSYIIGPL